MRPEPPSRPAGLGLTTRAPAKVNLTLHVLGRRADGYHELESLVVFAGIHDRLTLVPGEELSLVVEGPTAGAAGPPGANLVIRAARALAERRPGLLAGAFHLTKRLPAAAGIGGGSSDAAGALRLLARLNGLALDHPDVVEAARVTGADIPVCLDPRARMMRGAGEEVGPPLALPPLFAVLVNPGVAVPTAGVFKSLGLSPGQMLAAGASFESDLRSAPQDEEVRGIHPRPHAEMRAGPAQRAGEPRSTDGDVSALFATLAETRNDLEAPALALAPEIGSALARLRATKGCRLARMSGSGATVFGLYDDCRAAARAAKAVRSAEPGWWVKATVFR
ncbi:4-(cytidine 5'-diphospho)-2-C-methyl-D-erythritol kinase [uncultured Enterovirga sp.]|uniref:4-(cytidine 5'-diphospho)-2-C-methyl-D-erythritol kinase n=1 Tax=uncultured Enterovirga sp. TaxID=2026352 RepID=UPI0035CC02DF